MCMARKKQKIESYDSVFILKLILYLILGMFWLWIVDDTGAVNLVLPAGPLIGLLFAAHEHFQIDRKLEYTVLILSSFVSFLLEAGIYI